MIRSILFLLLTLLFTSISNAQSDSISNGLKGEIVRAFEQSPTSPTTFYAGLKGNNFGTGLIYKSIDSGQSWFPLNNGKALDPYVSDVQSVAELNTPDHTLFAGTWKNGLFKSEDGGSSWAKDVNFPSSDIRSIRVGKQNPQLIYASTSNYGVVTSINGGKSWIRNKPEIIENTFQFAWSIELDPTNDNIIYAQTFDRGIWKSTNQGETWVQILETDGNVCWDMKVSTSGKQLWVATSKRGDRQSAIYHSKDSGLNWEKLNEVPQIGINQVTVVEESNTLYIGSWQDGVYQLKENDWLKIAEVDESSIAHLIVANSKLLIGSWGNGIYSINY